MPTRSIRTTSALALALGFVAIYTLSASHTVILDNLDAAEFQTVGSVGGILHQPYPLWTILARTFAAIPVFQPAFRVTLVSILFGAACVVVLFSLLVRRTGSIAASAGTAAAFGLSFTFWQFSAVAEVYALTTFLFVLFLYLTERLVREDSETTALLLALTMGTLVSQQSLNAAAAPGLLLLLIVSPRARRQLLLSRGLGLRVAAFLLPFTLYLYTFFVDRASYPMNWLDTYGQYLAQSQGHDAPQMHHFLGRIRFQMWISRLNPEFPAAKEYARSAYYWIRYFCSVEFPFVVPVLALVGLRSAWRRDMRFTLFLLVLAAPYVALALTNWGEKYAYSFPAYAVAMLFAAEGIGVVVRVAKRSRVVRPLLTAVAALLVATMPLLRYATASPVSRWLRSSEAVAEIEASRHVFLNLDAHNDDGMEYGRRVDELLSPGDLIVGGWKETNVLYYHQLVAGALSGVTVSYVLPEAAQTMAVIERVQPAGIYFTFPPDRRGLTRFPVTEVIDVLPGQRLYSVRVEPDASSR